MSALITVHLWENNLKHSSIFLYRGRVNSKINVPFFIARDFPPPKKKKSMRLYPRGNRFTKIIFTYRLSSGNRRAEKHFIFGRPIETTVDLEATIMPLSFRV